MAKQKPPAFLSYAHDDDAHEQGKLREFAKRLAGEVRLHSGEEFPIFVDREISTGAMSGKRGLRNRSMRRRS